MDSHTFKVYLGSGRGEISHDRKTITSACVGNLKTAEDEKMITITLSKDGDGPYYQSCEGELYSSAVGKPNSKFLVTKHIQ